MVNFRRILLAGLGCWLATVGLHAQGPDGPPVRDTLVYKDGDRLQGRLITETKEVITFLSERFGQIVVAREQAVVIKGTPVAATPAPTEDETPATDPAAPALVPEIPSALAEQHKAEERADHERIFRWDNFSPAVLTAKMREFFGPWSGRVAFSTEVVSDATERGTLSLESSIRRKWPKDEVSLSARYDYAQTTEVTTTDMVRADGSWRHDFRKNRFLQYRPSLEWNRASYPKVAPIIPNDYILIQQEIGVGLTLLNKPSRKLRAGVSENLFHTWTVSPPRSSNARAVESLFLETELKLPGGLLLTDRGVYYYSLSGSSTGWENRVELTKKFTETLSTALRHDIRTGTPDGTVQDYTRLKLLIGLDF